MNEQEIKTTNILQSNPVICSSIELKALANNEEVLRFMHIRRNGVTSVPCTPDKLKSFKNNEKLMEFVNSEIEKNKKLLDRIEKMKREVDHITEEQKIQNNLVPILVE